MLTSLTSLVAPPVGAFAHVGPWGGGPGPGFGWLFLLVPLFWIGVVALIISLAARRRRRFWAANGGKAGAWGPGFGPGWGGPGAAGAGWGGAGWGPGAGDGIAAAEKTLAERFAQGDIDEVDYRARLEVLRANRQGPPAAS